MTKLGLFIDYGGKIDDIARAIGELLGIELTKDADGFGENYVFRFLDIEFVLYGDHGLEDDCGIVFSDYSYEIQMIKLRTGEKYNYYDEMYEKTAMFLAEKLSRAFGANVMLVDNLQILVSKIDTMKPRKIRLPELNSVMRASVGGK